MLNIEKNYKEILENKGNFAINEQTGEMLRCCSECNCEECKFYYANNSCDYDSCEEAKLAWLFEEYKEPLLTEDEREFLKLFAKLFECRELCIEKCRSCAMYEYCYLKVTYGGFEHSFYFHTDKAFKGLELDKKYTLEDLKLDE